MKQVRPWDKVYLIKGDLICRDYEMLQKHVKLFTSLIFLILNPEQANKKSEVIGRPNECSVNYKEQNCNVNCFILLFVSLEGTQTAISAVSLSRDTAFSVALSWSSNCHKLIPPGLCFQLELYLCLVGTQVFFNFVDCLLLAVFGFPLNFHIRIVAQLQLVLFPCRLCLCDLAWLIFHATALRKYLSISSTVKISPTSTCDIILWDQVEQGVLSLFAGLQIIFFSYIWSSGCEHPGVKGVYCLFLWDVKDWSSELLTNEGTRKPSWAVQADISFQQFTVFVNSFPQIIYAKFYLRWALWSVTLFVLIRWKTNKLLYKERSFGSIK